jgi:tRNA A-37 threonylcarbamoyl transferase component Bud32
MDTFLKHNVLFHEFTMYNYVDKIKFSFLPKLLSYNSKLKQMKMQRIHGDNLSDQFGEKFDDVPKCYIQDVRSIVSELYNHGIVYPDITGYNFILETGKEGLVWVIDFEHAFFRGYHEGQKQEAFVQRFIDGKENQWNPNFA